MYVVSIGTFDTHANQCDPDDHEVGTHADLLKQLSDAIAGFQAAIDQSGNSKRVLGMTFLNLEEELKPMIQQGLIMVQLHLCFYSAVV